MRKPTGQMEEDTQELLDHFNSHYNWEYNDMCRFIENHSEEEFRKHYETYNRLCDDYGTELVDNFGFYYVNEVDKTTKDIPNWVTIDYKDVWENKLSEDYFEIDCDGYEYTYVHIFKKTV